MQNRLFTDQQKITHFTYIDLLNDKPTYLVELTLPKSAAIPQGFGLEKWGTAYFGADMIPQAKDREFYAYNTREITDWPPLKSLFDTLKSTGYSVFYTFDGAHREVEDFDTFKNAVISEYNRHQKGKAELFCITPN